MTLEVAAGALLLGALTVYVLGGGADFGGGVWDLFARGPRAREQRETIAEAIGPIWEANHVWLILAIVVLFVAFPPAFAAMATALHIPLTLILVGIVLRGSAFTFRTYDDIADREQRRWGRTFAMASVVTPVMLGVCVGAIASGEIGFDANNGRVRADFVSAWLRPFPFVVGFFTLALFALLAGVYLTVEARDRGLCDDFRHRALTAAAAVGALAWLSLLLAADGAPRIREGLLHRPWSLPFQVLTGAAALGVITALWLRRFHAARAGGRPDDTDPLGMGGRAVSVPVAAGPHVRFRRGAAAGAAAGADRCCRRRRVAGALVVGPLSRVQGQPRRGVRGAGGPGPTTEDRSPTGEPARGGLVDAGATRRYPYTR